ncbi:GMC family oxidoreductase [Candidatus Parcubacteria bacterium]|nr:GMC family oxidoreductase [Candidatus Parcubacteria bacterium]
MIRDLKDYQGPLAYDICIVGSGPSGMTVAAELAASGLRIGVIESGSFSKSAFADSLKEVDSKGLAVRAGSRERLVGGSTHQWGGVSAPLDPIDFKKRAGLPAHTGWPISQEELGEYMEAAAARYRYPNLALFALPGFLHAHEINVPPWNSLEQKTFIAAQPVLYYGREFRYLFNGPNLDLITEASVVSLRTEGVAGECRVTSAAIKIFGEKESKVTAKVFILAAGAIENARILLNSTDTSPLGLGNQHGQVGRYFMNHPKAYLGRIRLSRPLPNSKAYFWGKRGHFTGYAGLRLKEESQLALGVLNSYVRLEPEFPWTDRKELRALRNFFASLKTAANSLRHFDMKAFAECLRVSSVSLWRLLAVSPAVIYLLAAKMRYGRNPEPRVLRLRFFLEMEPRAENRVVLSGKKDALGTPIPEVRCELSECDKKSFRALQKAVAEEFSRLGLGILEMSAAEKERFPVEDASHHLGTTRMGDDPRTSVVGPDLRVHSVENLFVAGGSVFPTSGCANPTMVIAALSIRLARHLRESVFKVNGQREEPRGLPVLLVGAGKRVREDILPVLESLPELRIAKVFARIPRVLFGAQKIYAVESLSKLSAHDVAAARIVYLSVPAPEVPAILELLLSHDCSHLDLIVPTPATYAVPRGKFKNVWVEEDIVFLPWLPPLMRLCVPERKGPLVELIFDRSAYRYHAVALVKKLCGKIRLSLTLGHRMWLWCGLARAYVRGPRDYATGTMRLVAREAVFAEKPAPGTIPIAMIEKDGQCVGFRVDAESEHLSPPESELFGPLSAGTEATILTRMHDCKRVGLRRFLQAVVRNEAWSFAEGKNDALVDASPVFLS